jgi:Rps23 Pro-64 3,4-dihydroxylase Tpa1-like proline 4-hydroxylase
MAILTPRVVDGYICFDEAECAAAGAALADQYRTAQPYPHIVMDEFLPADFLRELLNEFPGDENQGESFGRAQEHLKTQRSPHKLSGRNMRTFLNELNSPAILKFLEAMTGIKHLMGDPFFMGGGLHETRAGGHLGVHADFNVHSRLNCERRLNLLIYLNDDWAPEYGGDLEIWDQKMQHRCHKIAPVMARAVVFNTALDSFHGQPDALTCPPDRSRRSIATYYYTAPEDGVGSLKKRTTVFRERAGTADKKDRRVQVEHFLRDWSPPKLFPVVRRLNPFR